MFNPEKNSKFNYIFVYFVSIIIIKKQKLLKTVKRSHRDAMRGNTLFVKQNTQQINYIHCNNNNRTLKLYTFSNTTRT